MKTTKNLILIFITFFIMIISCLYLFSINTAFDGGVNVSLSAFAVAFPIIAVIQLWHVFKGDYKKNEKQRHWQKILFWCLIASLTVLAVCLLISSNFYSLSAILLLTVIALGCAADFVEKSFNKTNKENPIFAWAITTIVLYAVICGTAFAYLKIVKPVTLAQAKDMVAHQYGEDMYTYIGWLTADKAETPLGVYWFIPASKRYSCGVTVSITTAEISENR